VPEKSVGEREGGFVGIMPTYGEVLGAWKSRWEIDIVQDKECGTFGFLSTCGSGGIGCMKKT